MAGIAESGDLTMLSCFVAPEAVLGPEGGGEVEVGQAARASREWGEVGGDRGRVGKEGDAPAVRAGRPGVGEKAVEAEADGSRMAGFSMVADGRAALEDEAPPQMEIGTRGAGMGQGQ